MGHFTIALDLYIGDLDIPNSSIDARKLTFMLEHDFNDTWSNKMQFRFGENEVEQIIQIIYGNAPDIGPSSWSLFNSYVARKQTEYSFNTSFEGKFSTGAWTLVVLFGADYSHIDDYSVMYMDYAGFNDLTNPGVGRLPQLSTKQTLVKLENMRPSTHRPAIPQAARSCQSRSKICWIESTSCPSIAILIAASILGRSGRFSLG